jgi:hypothetical protein
MKKFKDTKIGNFLKDKAPHILEVVGDVLPDKGALGLVKNLIDLDDKVSKDDKEEFSKIHAQEIEAFKLEVEDRKSARSTYISDGLIQKIFAMLFLVGYVVLSWYLITILMGATEMPQLAETMITMIWTGTSTKLGTIIDFFFGGSVK